MAQKWEQKCLQAAEPVETHAASENRGSDVLQASKTVPGKPGASNPLWGLHSPARGQAVTEVCFLLTDPPRLHQRRPGHRNVSQR